MGNNESRNNSDDEDLYSPYNFHEKVLRDARRLNRNTGANGYESDDQFFSADEGESDVSLTPPRDRPESSSGEDSSNDSSSNDFNDNVNNNNTDVETNDGNNDSRTGFPRTEENSGGGGRNLDVSEHSGIAANEESSVLPDCDEPPHKKRCGQCNISRFQEHDSIGPELDRSRWDASLVSPLANARIERNSQTTHSVSCADSAPPYQHESGLSIPSPFAPISPPGIPTASPKDLKRRVSQYLPFSEDTSELSPPKKRHEDGVIHLSPNKRRLRIADDDSVSDSDQEVSSLMKKPRSENQNSPSLIRRAMQSLKRSFGRNDDPSNVVSESGDVETNSKIGKFDLVDECVEKPDKELKRKVCSVRVTPSRQSDSSRNDSPDIQFKAAKLDGAVDLKSCSNVSVQLTDCLTGGRKHSFSQTPSTRRLLSLAAAQPAEQVLNQATLSSHQTASSIVPTMKMGNDAVRNAHGKVLPVRRSCQTTSANSSYDSVLVASNVTTQSSPPVSTSQSDSSLAATSIGTRAKSLRVRKRSFHASSGLNDSTCQNGPSPAENNQDNVSVSGSISKNGIGKSCDGEDSNPFKGIVLTPPTGGGGVEAFSSSVNSPPTPTHLKSDETSHHIHSNHSNLSTARSQDIVVAMETDEDVGVSPSPRANNSGRSLSSAAKGFKRFLSNRNNKLKSKLSTFFTNQGSTGTGSAATPLQSLSGSAPQPPIFPNQTNWSLFSSSPQSAYQPTSSPISNYDGRLSVHFSPNISSLSMSSPVTQQLTPLTSPSEHPTVNTADTLRSATRSSARLRKSKTTSTPKDSIPRTQVANATPSPSVAQPNDHNGKGTDSQRETTNTSGSDLVVSLPQTSQYQVVHHLLCSVLELSVSMGDIADEDCSGIVNWTDGALTHTVTECSRRICARAGALMRAGCNSYVENKGGHLVCPDVLTTPAGGRFARCVQSLLHVVSPAPDLDPNQLPPTLLDVNANCLRFASERLGLDSLAMPLIGEGEFSTQLCAEVFIDAVLLFIDENEQQQASSSLSSSSFLGPNLNLVRLVTSDATATDLIAEIVLSRLDALKECSLGSMISDIRHRYFGQRDAKDDQELCSLSYESETTGRTASGRPTVKRRRF